MIGSKKPCESSYIQSITQKIQRLLKPLINIDVTSNRASRKSQTLGFRILRKKVHTE